jgi:uncharacterized Zn-binding protein involved in type VI secretion
MSKPFIVLGDKTSHGGVVISCSTASDCGGIKIARVGDKVSCPIPGHGVNPIITGDNTTIIDGQAVARQGDTTACGATLIPSQIFTTAG